MTLSQSVIRHHRRKRRAQGQVEILSTTVGRSVAVIGLISVIALGYFLINESESEAMVAEIEAINSAIQDIYLPIGSYEGLDSWSLAASGSLPASYTGGAFGSQQIFTPWHNIININLYSVNTQADSYSIFMWAVPAETCNTLATTQFKGQQSIQIWSTQWNYVRFNTDQQILPSEISDACGNAGAMVELYFSNTALSSDQYAH